MTDAITKQYMRHRKGRAKGGPDRGDPFEAYIGPAEQTVVFHHIRKTGGTSLRSLMHWNYRNSEFTITRAPRDNPGRFYADWLAGRKGAIRAVASHSAAYLVPLLDRPAALTIVREPVDHALSSYFFGTRKGKPPSVERLATEQQSPFYNFQAASLLAPWYDTAPLHGPPRDESLWHRRLREVLDLFVVGTTEAMGETVDRFAERCGWEVPTIPHAKLNPDRPGLDQIDLAVVEQIKCRNWLDRHLYGLAAD